MAIVLTIVGIACVLYGAAVMSLWSGTWFFAVWYLIGAILLAAAWCLHSGLWQQIPLVARRVIEIAALALAIAVAVFMGMALSGFSQQGDDDLDCIVVLGAQVHEDRPSTVLRYRLDRAYDYLAEHEHARCIVSGGKGFNEPRAEADVMGEYLESRGIDPARITRERESLNTAQNIANSMKLFDAQHDRIGIVTNNFHVFRGTGIARKAGVAHVCGIAAPSDPRFLPNNLLREAFSIAKDYATGNL